MKNLLKITSAIALIAMSEPAFASNIQNIDEEAIFYQNCFDAGLTDLEIEQQYRDLFGNQQNPSTIIPAASQASLIDLTVTSTSTSSSSSVAKSEVIAEEAKKPTSIFLKDLKPQGTNHTIFESIHTDVINDVVKLTGSKSKDYCILHWINKEKDNRLYNSSCWSQFQKRGFAHDPIDINMVSASQQLSLAQAIYYKAFYDRTNIEITDFIAHKDQTGRSVQELISAMSNINTNNTQSSNAIQSSIHRFMH